MVYKRKRAINIASPTQTLPGREGFKINFFVAMIMFPCREIIHALI